MSDAALALPTGWRPLSYWARTQDGITQLGLPATTFLRCVQDDSRGGLPYLAFELFWIEAGVVHLGTATGWALELSAEDDPTEEPQVAEQSEHRLDELKSLQVDGDAEPYAEFAGQVRLSGALARLIHDHLEGGPTGYANSEYEPIEA